VHSSRSRMSIAYSRRDPWIALSLGALNLSHTHNSDKQPTAAVNPCDYLRTNSTHVRSLHCIHTHLHGDAHQRHTMTIAKPDVQLVQFHEPLEPYIICSEYTMLRYNSFFEVVQVST